MKISIPYGRKSIPIEIPRGCPVEILEPAAVTCAPLPSLLEKSLIDPKGNNSLREFLGNARSVLFIVNDATRATPTAQLLDYLHHYTSSLETAYVVATGTHRPPGEKELERIFGHHLPAIRARISIHECRNKDILISKGTTSFGTKVYVNRILFDFDCAIAINSVEPHYFAGYTGGRKSIVPGLAGEETIWNNHRQALSPDSRTLRLGGNPVHDDMVEATRLSGGKIFSIQTVLDRNHQVFALESGDIFLSHERAAKSAEQVYCRRIGERADIILAAVLPPSDSDLYQAHKAIEHGKLALRDGGIIILVAPCPEGKGPDSFIELLASAGSPEEALKKLEAGYRTGYHKSAKIAELLGRAQIWAVTDLPPATIASIFWRPFDTVSEALSEACRIKGEGARIVIILDSGYVVPSIKIPEGQKP
jgi:lactate racemase